ncbi:MAG: hypothetical protein QOH29_1517, partial [Actinomycetota bacterium]|nr:hypothetical protein [Actinomycetota bacterium]
MSPHHNLRDNLRAKHRLRAPLAASVATVMAVGLGIGAGSGTALASGHGSPAATVAAIAPALTQGRGADVPFVEQEAETAATNGTVIGPDRTPYTLAAEASGRSAVQLTKPGDYVEFTLPREANALTVRYSIPDAPNGGGITAPIDVYFNGKHKNTQTLTSQYAWLYNLYPFSNDPNAGVLHPDWWITECQCVPNSQTPPFAVTTPFRPNHFYDEQRILLNKTYDAGTKVRFQVPTGSNAASYVIDLLDSQVVEPTQQPHGSLSVLTFGADRTGAADSAGAFDAAIAAAKLQHKSVFIPRGTYQVNRHIIVDNVTVTGAGSWYTI